MQEYAGEQAREKPLLPARRRKKTRSPLQKNNGVIGKGAPATSWQGRLRRDLPKKITGSWKRNATPEKRDEARGAPPAIKSAHKEAFTPSEPVQTTRKTVITQKTGRATRGRVRDTTKDQVGTGGYDCPVQTRTRTPLVERNMPFRIKTVGNDVMRPALRKNQQRKKGSSSVLQSNDKTTSDGRIETETVEWKIEGNKGRQ